MTPFTLISLLIIAVLLAITVPCTWLIYRYTRPKTGPMMAVLKWEAVVVSLLLISTLVSALWPIAGCAHPMPVLSSGPVVCATGTITVGGSTALQTLMSAVATSYIQQCPLASINVIASAKQSDIGKSETGLDNVEDGSIQIGTSDRFATSYRFATSEKSDLIDHEIAASVFVVIVNRGVDITNLTTGQIQGIYSGKYKNWQELGGPNLSIKPLSRSSGSGTRFTFDTYILNDDESVAQLAPMQNTSAMITGVQNTPGAIGYADLHDVYVNLQSLIPVSIDGVSASIATVLDKSYKFWTIEHMYTKGQATGLVSAFISYMGHDAALKIIESFSFINIHTVSGNILSNRCAT